MMSRGSLLMVATVSALLGTRGQAQVRQTQRAPEPTGCTERCGPRPTGAPAYLIRDTAGRMLTLVPPGDSTFYRREHGIVGVVEPRLIAAVEELRDTTAIHTLGRGFENGLVLLTLTDQGAELWRRHAGGAGRR